MAPPENLNQSTRQNSHRISQLSNAIDQLSRALRIYDDQIEGILQRRRLRAEVIDRWQSQYLDTANEERRDARVPGWMEHEDLSPYELIRRLDEEAEDLANLASELAMLFTKEELEEKNVEEDNVALVTAEAETEDEFEAGSSKTETFCMQFLIVDEHGRPLGGKSETSGVESEQSKYKDGYINMSMATARGDDTAMEHLREDVLQQVRPYTLMGMATVRNGDSNAETAIEEELRSFEDIGQSAFRNPLDDMRTAMGPYADNTRTAVRYSTSLNRGRREQRRRAVMARSGPENSWRRSNFEEATRHLYLNAYGPSSSDSPTLDNVSFRTMRTPPVHLRTAKNDAPNTVQAYSMLDEQNKLILVPFLADANENGNGRCSNVEMNPAQRLWQQELNASSGRVVSYKLLSQFDSGTYQTYDNAKVWIDTLDSSDDNQRTPVASNDHREPTIDRRSLLHRLLANPRFREDR